MNNILRGLSYPANFYCFRRGKERFVTFPAGIFTALALAQDISFFKLQEVEKIAVALFRKKVSITECNGQDFMALLGRIN